jgi:hypothetical protein
MMLDEEAAPFLDQWRQVAKSQFGLGVLVGNVSGHPSIKPGWMVSSPLLAISAAEATAQTQSRYYRLGSPYPDDIALPPAARRIVFLRMTHLLSVLDGRPMTLESVDHFRAAIEAMCGPVVPVD